MTEFLSARVSVQILSKHLLVDALGYTNVVGEVKNMGTQNVDFVQLTGTFYNSTNHVTGTDFTFTMLSILTPGEQSPFKITDLTKGLVVGHYKVAVTDASYTTDQPNTSLKVQGTSSNIDQIGYFHALGEVTNTASTTAKSVMVVLTFYNSTGGVVDASFTFTSPSDLNAGETGSFDSPTNVNVNMISSFVAEAQEGI